MPCFIFYEMERNKERQFYLYSVVKSYLYRVFRGVEEFLIALLKKIEKLEISFSKCFVSSFKSYLPSNWRRESTGPL